MILGILRDRLLTSAAVKKLIDSRITPYALPQGSPLPAADMRIVNTQANHHIRGSLKFYTSIVAVDCYAQEPYEADQIADAMSADGLVVGWQAKVGDISIRHSILADGIRQSAELETPGSERFRFVSSIKFEIGWAK